MIRLIGTQSQPANHRKKRNQGAGYAVGTAGDELGPCQCEGNPTCVAALPVVVVLVVAVVVVMGGWWARLRL